MIQPATLNLYLAQRMTIAVAVLAAGLASFVMLVDLIENLRYVAKVNDGGFGFAATVTLMRAPSVLMTLAPFVFLFGAISVFSQLNRRAEIAVMRAAGLSIWRLIAPAALVAAVSGVVLIAAIDPFSARLLSSSEKMKLELRGRTASLVQVFGDGLWLRQRDQDSVLIINARGFDPVSGVLSAVTVLRLDLAQNFLERIDATRAVFSGRTIELREARVRAAGEPIDYRTPVYAVTTNLTQEDLRENIDRAETMSIWRLPRFIVLAEAAGLPTLQYNIRFHDLCSTPLKLVAMVLIAATFSMRPHRQGGAFRLLLLAIVSGFILYVLSQISTALGLSGTVPAPLAAWIPAIVASLTAAWALFQAEEG